MNPSKSNPSMNYRKHLISINESGRDALKRLETLPDAENKTLFVLDDSDKLVGSLTDGDIRRGLLNDKEISAPVAAFMNRAFKCLYKDELDYKKLSEYRQKDILLLPLINRRNEIERIIDLKQTAGFIPATAVIMAGGKGTRLRPLTDNVPKPLLKVGNKPIIEYNIDRLSKFGVTDFYISIQHLGDQIRSYLGDGEAKGIKIAYLDETEPLGTVGAVSMIENIDTEHLLVMNADILSDVDFEDFYEFYLQSSADMCIGSIPYQVKVPYGVLEVNHEKIISLREKPTYTYYSNSGIYFIHKKVRDQIPKATFYNATDLMTALIDDEKKVSHYPILGYWMDIGKYEDYVKVQEDIKHIKF